MSEPKAERGAGVLLRTPAMSKPLPRAVQLPSGRVVELEAKRGLSPRGHEEGAPLFAEAIDLFESGHVTMRSEGAPLVVYALELRDFHALRAILTASGLLAEETLELTCRNCGAAISHAPCAAMPLGPFVDRELQDRELDATLELAVAHEIPAVRLGRGREAHDATLAPLTVEDALPLFRALGKREIALTGGVVRAMGIADLGGETNPARIARALSAATDEAWDAITELFLAAHYPARLFSIALCSQCGARNDVDAPYEREFEPPLGPVDAPVQVARAHSSPASSSAPVQVARAHSSPASSLAPAAASRPKIGDFPELPALDPFAERARAIADERFAAEGVDDVAFVVDGGVPAVDDGGEPLLGAYVPGSPGDMTSPSRSHEVTIYYRTFRAIWNEDGPFDWETELRETIAHEIEHHLAYLAGDDPTDEEERAEIRDEALRVLGKRALVREGVRTFWGEVADFLRRTWPIWLLLALATAAVTMTSR